jgi:anaerobic magnesium-protoporphyrin IX monomethyl ester cyclase
VDAYLDAGFDAVVPGEGEATLLELAGRIAAHRDLTTVPGLIVRREGRLVRGPHRPFLKDLDALPLPAWDLVDMERYLDEWQKRTGERRAAVLTSRGCPFDCSWCSKPTFGRTFRQQSPARVVEELVALKTRYGVDYVRFCDDVFGISRPWIDELIDRMQAADLGLQFECLARVDLLKPDLLHRLRSVGLARVYVGVESGSQKMLDLMNRGTKLGQVERTAAALRAEGIRQFWFLMLGYPGETLEDIEATLQLFRRFSPEEYSVSIAVPIPGTRFHQVVKDRLLRRKRAGTRGSGGSSLLYEAAYPETLYRWEQARFGLDAALGRARGRISPRLATGVSRVADRFHERVARPLLVGRRTDPEPTP